MSKWSKCQREKFLLSEKYNLAAEPATKNHTIKKQELMITITKTEKMSWYFPYKLLIQYVGFDIINIIISLCAITVI